MLDTLYFLITDKEPWVEEKYNYVISRLKDADGDKIPPFVQTQQEEEKIEKSLLEKLWTENTMMLQ